MLGYTQKEDNNVIIYFENDEIERLGKEIIRGTDFPNPLVTASTTALLEASIDDKVHLVEIDINKDDSNTATLVNLKLRYKEYFQFKEKGKKIFHEGCRHIELYDASDLEKLGLMDQFNYRQLKFYKS